MIPKHFLSGFFNISAARNILILASSLKQSYEVLRHHCSMPIFLLLTFDVNIVSHTTLLLRTGFPFFLFYFAEP